MKKRLIWLLGVACLCCAAAVGYLIPKAEETRERGNGVAAHGALHVDGTYLRDEQGEITVLRGMSSHGLQWYPRFMNGAAMQTLRSWGANVQRLAMYTQAGEAYLREPERNLDYLYMGIESVLSADMYVIVDWHILKDGDPNEHREEAKAFFREITAHYGDDPALIYEICNEPNGGTTWEDITRYAEAVIPVIRENAPNALILVGMPHYCTDISGPIEAPLPYENIMYTMHRYIDVSKQAPCNTRLIEKATGAALPIFVSEWGTEAEGERKEESGDYQENARPFIDYMEEHSISWTAWSLSNKAESHSILKTDCTKYSGWTQEDLTAFGKLIYSVLHEQSGR